MVAKLFVKDEPYNGFYVEDPLSAGNKGGWNLRVYWITLTRVAEEYHGYNQIIYFKEKRQ